jgi:hypothetical protein
MAGWGESRRLPIDNGATGLIGGGPDPLCSVAAYSPPIRPVTDQVRRTGRGRGGTDYTHSND